MSTYLAIDTATESCSVSLIHNNHWYSRIELTPRQHSQKILGLIEDVLGEAGITKDHLQGIAFGQGPGSFTGVRIGVSVAQGLGFGLDVPLVGVSNLQALAYPYLADDCCVIAAIDARMGEVYLGGLSANGKNLKALTLEEKVIKPSEVNLDEFSALIATKSCIAVGTGWRFIDEFPPAIVEKVKEVHADALPSAESILKLALSKFEAKDVLKPEECQPTYLRNDVAWKKVDQQ